MVPSTIRIVKQIHGECLFSIYNILTGRKCIELHTRFKRILRISLLVIRYEYHVNDLQG